MCIRIVLFGSSCSRIRIKSKGATTKRAPAPAMHPANALCQRGGDGDLEDDMRRAVLVALLSSLSSDDGGSV